MTDTDEVMVAEAILGDDARQFLSTDLGQYLMGRIEQDIEAAKDKLAEVDPDTPAEVRAAQFDLKVAKHLKQYLVDVITDGDNALQVLTSEE